MIYYNVKNKATGRTEVLTKVAKEMLEKIKDFSAKYEVIGECDIHGRNFDYSNFLNQTNATTIKPIETGTEQGTEKESEEGRNTESGIEKNDIESIGNTGSGNNNEGSEGTSKAKRNYTRKNK